MPFQLGYARTKNSKRAEFELSADIDNYHAFGKREFAQLSFPSLFESLILYQVFKRGVHHLSRRATCKFLLAYSPSDPLYRSDITPNPSGGGGDKRGITSGGTGQNERCLTCL
jgi:hypothetical protein